VAQRQNGNREVRVANNAALDANDSAFRKRERGARRQLFSRGRPACGSDCAHDLDFQIIEIVWRQCTSAFFWRKWSRKPMKYLQYFIVLALALTKRVNYRNSY
jgi:hypothetical protein